MQYKSLCRTRDIRDQLAGLCERVEVVVQSNPNSNDITPIQKALTAGYFYIVAQLQKSGDSYRTLKTNQTVYIHPSSSLFQHQPPSKTLLYYELVNRVVMTSESYVRQAMQWRLNIKPAWLLDGSFLVTDCCNLNWLMFVCASPVAPHYFKPEDLEQLSKGDKKMPKTVYPFPFMFFFFSCIAFLF